MMVVMQLPQQPCARQIDAKAEAGHGDGLAIDDRNRRHQPQHALIGDLDGDHEKDERAGKRREFAELAGAEGKTGMAYVSAREQIGDAGDPEGRGVRRHVPAVGQERHGAEKRSRNDLAHHHDDGQRDHEPGAALVARMLRPEEHMVVGPLIKGM